MMRPERMYCDKKTRKPLVDADFQDLRFANL